MKYALIILVVFTILLAAGLCNVSGEQSEIERLRDWCDEMNEEDDDDDDET